MIQRRHLIQAAGLSTFAGAQRPATAAPADAPYDWKSVPFGGGGYVNGFVFHPREAGLLYARTDIGGAYRFDAKTSSWLPLLDHLSKADSDLMGVLSIAVDPSDANRVYLTGGTYTSEWARKAALLSSNDRGATWTVTELGIKLGGNEAGRGTGERLQVDPIRGEILLLGTTKDGLMKSSDRGASFSRVAAFAAQHVSLVVFDPTRGTASAGAEAIYVGSHDKLGLYASRDRGQTFAREPGTPELAPQRAVFSAEGTLYVTFAGGDAGSVVNPSYAKTGSVWKRSRDGQWTDITPIKPGRGGQGTFGYSGIDTDRKVPGRLIVSTIERWTEGDDLFVSHDDGATWTPLGARSRHDASPYPWLVNYTRGQDKMGHWIADVKLDPFNSERAIYGTGYGLSISRNLGAAQKTGGTVNWDFTVANLEETATLEIKSPTGGASLLGAMGDVSGAAWDDLGATPKAGLFSPSNETVRSVDVAELNPGIMARTSDMAAAGGYTSVDGGASWRPFGASPRKLKTPEGWTAPTGRVAVSAKGGFLVWAPEKQPALWSRDRGRTWQLSEGWPADRSVALDPVADRALEGVFYVHDRAAGLVLASADGGQSFKPVASGLPKLEVWQTSHLIAAPGTVRDLWLALPDGLLHLPGPEKPAKTMKGVAEAWMVALGKAAPNAAYPSVYVWGRVFVGGEAIDGLFRSDDAGFSFKRIDDKQHRYGRLLSITADPLEHGVVYLAPHGRGVVVGRPRVAG